MKDRNRFSQHSVAVSQSTDEGRAVNKARDHVNSPLSYQWTDREGFVLDHFFTNKMGRVAIMRGLPASLCGQFFSMCATNSNNRSIRGTFVDKFFPALLSAQVPKCREDFRGDSEAFLTSENLSTLDKFIDYSDETRAAFEAFGNAVGDSQFLLRLSSDSKLKERYGHAKNSMGLFLFCFDGISNLTAQGIQRLKPFFGSSQPNMLLSNFYPNLSGRDHYPIEQELEILGADRRNIESVIDKSFDYYYDWRGVQDNGKLIEFFENTYRRYMDKEELKRGAIGEAYNVLASFIPACMYTSFGIFVWQHEFPDFLRNLLTDDTPESTALSELLCYEVNKVGYDLEEHLDSSSWARSNQGHMTPEIRDTLRTEDFMPNSEEVLRILGYSATPQSSSQWLKILEKLVAERDQSDALPEHFKNVKIGLSRVLSFRALCGLQRSPFSTIYRSRLDPFLGFMEYDKLLPRELEIDFKKIHNTDRELVRELTNKEISPNLQQYVMAMGNRVRCSVFGSLYLWEKVINESTSFSTPHGVRKFFVGSANSIISHYSWMRNLMRVDLTPTYIFHATKEPHIMPANIEPT